MKAIKLRAPYQLDRLTPTEIHEPAKPGSGEILVRLQGSSLNFHDYLVAIGKIPTTGRESLRK
jgi:NADPH:quinone reductase-like Zn-dependent oxidoreductase